MSFGLHPVAVSIIQPMKVISWKATEHENISKSAHLPGTEFSDINGTSKQEFLSQNYLNNLKINSGSQAEMKQLTTLHLIILTMGKTFFFRAFL